MTRRACALLALLLPLAAGRARAQEEAEVNGFLVEEAYNQDAGQLQQILHWTRVRGGAWEGVYSQEWPLGGERHQLAVSVPLVRSEAGAQGLGDVELEYRFGAVGGSGERFTFSPGVGLTLPTGSERRSLGGGQTEAALLLPASLRLLDGRLYLHTNVNATVPVSGDTHAVGLTFGESAMLRPLRDLTLLVDAVYDSEESPLAVGGREDRGWVLSPGVQYALHLGGKTQLVPGIAFPFDPSGHSRGIFLYLTADHPFRGR